METRKETSNELEKELKKLLIQLHSILSHANKNEMTIDNYSIKIKESEDKEGKPNIDITCLEIPEYDLIEDILNLAGEELTNRAKINVE